MELRQLEYFLMVSELQSFTRSAERLYVSQPAVTNAIRSLEDELDIQLFDRSQRKAQLTAEGKIFYRHIKHIMQGISTTLNEINDLKSHNSGSLTIGITPLGGMKPFLRLLSRFQELYPHITLKLVDGMSDELEGRLLDDKLDFMLGFTDDTNQNTLFTYLKLPPEELMLACSRQHPFGRRNSLPLTALVNEAFISFPSDSFFRRLIRRHFEQVEAMPQIAFETMQVQTMKSLLESGLGISILPYSLLGSDNELAAVPLEPPLYIQPVLLHKTARHKSYAAQAFYELAAKGTEII